MSKVISVASGAKLLNKKIPIGVNRTDLFNAWHDGYIDFYFHADFCYIIPFPYDGDPNSKSNNENYEKWIEKPRKIYDFTGYIALTRVDDYYVESMLFNDKIDSKNESLGIIYIDGDVNPNAHPDIINRYCWIVNEYEDENFICDEKTGHLLTDLKKEVQVTTFGVNYRLATFSIKQLENYINIRNPPQSPKPHKSNNTELLLISVLKDLLLDSNITSDIFCNMNNPKGKPVQSELTNTIVDMNIKGLSKRTIDSLFSKANQTLTDTKKQ